MFRHHPTRRRPDLLGLLVPLRRLRDAALVLEGGGVGYYPTSDFVHVDVGRVRRW